MVTPLPIPFPPAAHFHQTGGWRLLPLVALLAVAGLRAGHGSMTVTGEVVVEASPADEPRRVRFTLTNSPASPAATTWEYATQPDSAREEIDYVGQRGRVTIPANARTAVVEIPLIADAWKEPTESFSLLVWPEGGSPITSLTEIARPVIGGLARNWQGGEIGASEGSFFINRSLGGLTAGVWAYEREVEPVGGPSDFFGIPASGYGRWMLVVEGGPMLPGGWSDVMRLHVADRLSSSQVPLRAHPPVEIPGVHGVRSLPIVRGNVACIHSLGACRFYQLDPLAVPKLLGECILPHSRESLFDGRRLVSVSEDDAIGLQIFEATDPGLATWQLVKTMPGAKRLAALDGDRLVLRRDMEGPIFQTFFHIHERNAGGTNGWGETAVVTVNDDEGERFLGTASLTGNLLLVGDSDDLGGARRAGKIHVFMKEPEGAGWALIDSFSAPDSAAGDRFGARVNAGGTTMLTLSGSGPNRAWISSLSGGSATIVDDDRPTVHVSAVSEFEPSQASRAAKGWLWMTHASSEPVLVAWRAESGTAVSGEDFSAREQTTVIPPGTYAVPIEVPMLPDATAEIDEFFSVVIAAITGPATSSGSPARWTIRDTDRVPTVYATPTYLYEGVTDLKPALRVDPKGADLGTGWALRETAGSPVGLPRDLRGFAESGSDFSPSSGTIQSSQIDTHSLPVAALRDGLIDPGEVATLAVELDPLSSAGSYGTRAFQTVTNLPSGGAYTGNVSTDGDGVAIEVSLSGGGAPRRGVHVYVRDPAAPGGWRHDQLLRLADFGVPDLEGLDFLRLRQGRLCYYLAPAGRVWILARDASDPGAWKLEATFMSLHGAESPFQLDADFDGDVFITTRRTIFGINQLFIHERGRGDWTVHQDIVIANLVAGMKLDGPTIVGLTAPTANTRSIVTIERRGYGAAPWVRGADSPMPSDVRTENTNVKLHRDVMILERMENPFSLVVRRRNDGIWVPEQNLDAEIVGMDRGVLIGRWSAGFGQPYDRTFADTGSPPNRWILLPASAHGFSPLHAAPSGITYDHCRRVLVGAAEFTNPILGGDYIPGHYIAEPGADVRIIDSESFELNVGFDTHDGEHPTAETPGLVEIYRSPAALIDIRIPFRTTGGGTAMPGLDYRPVIGIMTRRAGDFLDGNPTASFVVPILPDRVFEGQETIEIEFDAPSFGVVRPNRILMPIAADVQVGPAVSMPRPPVVFEPLAGQRMFVLPVRMVSAFAQPLLVGYSIGGQSAGAGDFIQGPGTVTVPAGRQDVPIPLTVFADALAEGPESLRVSIISFNGATIPATHFDIFIDDAATPGGVADVFATLQHTLLPASPSRNLAANDIAGMGDLTLARPAEHGTVIVNPDGTFQYEPDANFLGLDRFAYQGTIPGVELLREDVSWRWLHPLNGQDPENSIPGFQANWMKPDFDDSSWSPGAGLMGYGTLGAGAGQSITTDIGTPAAIGDRYTAYFRASFTAPDAPGPGWTLQFACDDAAIVYLNGDEIGRYAKPPNSAFFNAPDTYRLLALDFHDAAEETVVRTLPMRSAQIRPGHNVLAISLHNTTTSSDLGLRVTSGRTGLTTHPVLVEVNVTDGSTVPRVLDDSIGGAVTTRPLDSLFFPNGSVYSNDGLFDASGVPFDPILEVETGGFPAGPVFLDQNNGHFRIASPDGFFGSTSFTYRIRDKDGWSNRATVTVTAEPVRRFDTWRESTFGGGSANLASAPGIDTDGDALANLAEFAFGTDPKAPNVAPILTVTRRGGGWVAVFEAQPGFGSDCLIRLETSPSLDAGEWRQLALLNDQYESVEEFADGVTKTTAVQPSTRLLYTIQIPPSLAPNSFFRLRVSQERHLMDP